ncbi:MAG: ABC transporter ATP-binding protein [Bacilli bacterium]
MLNSNIRVDLHIHSKISEYKDRDIVKNSTFDNIDTLLFKLNEHNISLFGFSDHNRFDSELFIKTRKYIQSEKKKSEFPSIKNILPVVEFDVVFEENMEKCHVLAVFDLNTEEELKELQMIIDSDCLKKPEDVYSKNRFDQLIRKINTDVILIAAQRKALDNPRGGKNSLSNSVSDVYEFLKVGYISALEIQKPSVHGMILNNLVDFPDTIAFTYGSDCHQWDLYPKHSDNENMANKQFCFSIKAEPTFTGLVMAFTSPHSRFNRIENVNYKYIQNIELNNVSIPLSFGINAIIGENGSGKSSIVYGLLNELKTNRTSYAKKILTNNHFKTIPNNLNTSIFAVRQSEIINNENKGFAFGDKNEYFNYIDNTDLKKIFLIMLKN